MMNKKIIILIVAAIVLIGGLYYYTTANSNSTTTEKDSPVEDIEKKDETPKVDIAFGELAPDFTLENLDGEEVSLSDYRGKLVLLNFWATWCGYCDAEMPDLNKLNDENEDIVVLAVDVKETKETVQKYITKGEYEFEVLLDTKGAIAQTYLVGGYPTSYFIDKEGILQAGYPGMMTYAQMNQFLDSIREDEDWSHIFYRINL